MRARSETRRNTCSSRPGALAGRRWDYGFPPPYNFFRARETSLNLGYNWYRQDSESSFSFGGRQAKQEANLPDTEDRRQEPESNQ